MNVPLKRDPIFRKGKDRLPVPLFLADMLVFRRVIPVGDSIVFSHTNWVQGGPKKPVVSGVISPIDGRK